MATVSDRKIPVAASGNALLVGSYRADVVTAVDYSPFGIALQGRVYNNHWKKYRYGFNGKENDNEVDGPYNTLDYGMRIYDARLGRFLTVDPLTKQFPHYTPYQFAGNSPIANIDLDGEEEKYYKLTIDEKTGRPNLQLVRSVDQKSFLGFSWSPTLTYYVEYPQGPTGSRSYTFTRTGGAFAPENKIKNFDAWVQQENIGEFDRPEYVFASDVVKVGRSFNAAAEVGMQNGVMGRRNAAGKSFTVSQNTNKQSTAANGGNTEAANANNNANQTVSYEGKTYEVKATVPYKRPNNATTVKQREVVNQPGSTCATCGTSKGPFVADHKTPLAVEHISTGTIDKQRMRTIETVQSQCRSCSLEQSQAVRKVSVEANKIIRERQNGNGNGN